MPRPLLEGEVILEGQRLRARLIREGLSKNRNLWTRKILEKLAGLAEGVPVHLYDLSKQGDKTFLGHWGQLRRMLPAALQALLPDRLPEATVGHVRNPSVVVEEDGKASVMADIEVAESAGWVRGLWDRLRAVGHNLGLSIHVAEDQMKSTPLPGGGVELIDVTGITGWDVVTFPSAGGAFVPVLEGLLHMEDTKMKELIKRLLRLIPEAKRTVLLEALKVPKETESISVLMEGDPAWVKAYLGELKIPHKPETAGAVLEGLALLDLPEPPKPNPQPAGGGGQPQPRPAMEGGTPPQPNPSNAPPPDPRLDGVLVQMQAWRKDRSRDLMEAELKAANLPAGVAEFARTQLTARLESAGVLEAQEIKDFMTGLKKSLGQDQQRPALESVGPHIEMGITSGDLAGAALEALLDRRPSLEVDVNGRRQRVDAFRSIKHAYQVLTGDVYMEGLPFFARRGHSRGALESMDLLGLGIVREYMARGGAMEAAGPVGTSNFPLILSDRIHKILVKRYLQQNLNWRLLARPETVTDFKLWRFQKFGEFADLANVAEAGAYVNFDSSTGYPGEEEVTLAVTKKGQLATFSWESIVNDDTRRFQAIPDLMARAAARTLNKAVWGMLGNNSVIYDTNALAHTAHNNIVTTAWSLANAKALRNKIVTQKDLNNREAGRYIPRRVFVGTNLWDVVYDTLYSPNKPSLSGTDTNQAAGTAKTLTNDNPNLPNILRGEYGLTPYEILPFNDVAGADNDYWMCCDPDEVDQIIVAFLNGRQEPELFVQDLERVGSFFSNDQVTYKCRHIWNAAVIEYRCMAAGIVP